jgi:tripartite-type tricarboxylate transporter receptor subunit TctC
MNTALTSRRNFLHACGAGVTLLGVASLGGPAFAQAPVDHLRVLCGYPSGSAPDIVARAIAAELGRSYARGATVDNVAGATGCKAVAALKASSADGSTLLIAPGTAASVLPYLFQARPYDPELDLKPVSVAAVSQLWLVVGPAVPASVTDARALLEWMHDNPKLAAVGTTGASGESGIVARSNLMMAKRFLDAGIAWEQVGFNGAPQVVSALLGGQLAAAIVSEVPLRAHVKAGKLRVLATSGARRNAAVPAVGTFAEQGFRKLVADDWFGCFLPGAATPAAVEVMSQRLRAALAQPKLVAALGEAGLTAAPCTPAGMTGRIATERNLWEPVIKAHNMRVG